MSNQESRGEESALTGGPRGNGLADNTVALRLPARSDYLSVLRATVGVVAGNMSFTYDELVQLRVAASEAFGLALKHLAQGHGSPEVSSVTVYLVVGAEALEVLVTDPGFRPGPVESAEEAESRAVLESLVDTVEFGVEAAGERVIRLVKRRPGG